MVSGANEWTNYIERASRTFGPSPAPSEEQVKVVGLRLLEKFGKSRAREVIARHSDGGRIIDIKPDRRAAFIAECNSLLADDEFCEVLTLRAPTNEKPMQSVIDEAADIIRGRRTLNGAPERSFSTIADLWNTYLGAIADEAGTPFKPIEPYQVCDMMELLKIARAIHGDPTARDHYVDRIGYAAIAHELVEAKR